MKEEKKSGKEVEKYKEFNNRKKNNYSFLHKNTDNKGKKGKEGNKVQIVQSKTEKESKMRGSLCSDTPALTPILT